MQIYLKNLSFISYYYIISFYGVLAQRIMK